MKIDARCVKGFLDWKLCLDCNTQVFFVVIIVNGLQELNVCIVCMTCGDAWSDNYGHISIIVMF